MEKKDSGELSIQSKRGNTIKKAAKPDDPAVHLARPGNDVVKNQSELQVEEKGSSSDKKDEEATAADGLDDHNKPNGEAPESAKTGEKRKADDEAEGEPETAKKARGRPKGSAAKATQKVTPTKKEKATPAKKAEKKAAPAPAAEGEKKSRGRPKGSGTGAPAKAKKDKKAPAQPNGIGKRTRSQRK